MSFWTEFSRLLTVDEIVANKDFSLGEREIDGFQFEDASDEVQYRSSSEQNHYREDDPIPQSYEEMKKGIETLFHLPANKDIVVREFWTNTQKSVKGMVVFIDGMADKMVINSFILEPLLFLTKLSDSGYENTDIQSLTERLIPGNQVSQAKTWKDLTNGILSGSTAILVDGTPVGLIVESKGWEHRSVGVALNEPVIQGPHDSFTENFRANTGLVRARLHSKDLITEMLQLGKITRTDVAVMYMSGIANPKIVTEVKRRIQSLELDYIQDSGYLEQLIEDSPFSLFPKMLGTERPDRVAAKLMEGHVAIFVGHSPFVLIAPAVFWSLLQTPEDANLKFPFGGFTRLIRVMSLMVSMLLPSLYIAVTNYHPEMIPSDLMFTIVASREKVPFPIVIEVLIMEFSIELIREAGIRIPSVIGPTIGIVGALILGQAAVTAGIVSPLLVIAVALTALASFTLPNYNFSFGARLARFLFLVAAAMYGFYGICLGLLVLLMHLATLKSFGVPFLSPVAPYRSSSQDVIWQGPAFKQEERPAALRPLRRRRQNKILRKWDVRATTKFREDES